MDSFKFDSFNYWSRKQPIRFGANSFTDKGIINGNYTGQLDDIQVLNYAFTKEQVVYLMRNQ